MHTCRRSASDRATAVSGEGNGVGSGAGVEAGVLVIVGEADVFERESCPSPPQLANARTANARNRTLAFTTTTTANSIAAMERAIRLFEQGTGLPAELVNGLSEASDRRAMNRPYSPEPPAMLPSGRCAHMSDELPDERPFRRREYSGPASTLGLAALIVCVVGAAIWYFEFRNGGSAGAPGRLAWAS